LQAKIAGKTKTKARSQNRTASGIGVRALHFMNRQRSVKPGSQKPFFFPLSSRTIRYSQPVQASRSKNNDFRNWFFNSSDLNRTRCAIGTLVPVTALSVSTPEKFLGGVKLAPAHRQEKPDFRAQSAQKCDEFQPFLGTSKAVS